MTGSFHSDEKKRLILALPARAGSRFCACFNPEQRERKPLTAPGFRLRRRLNQRGGAALIFIGCNASMLALKEV
jgi:hypothetical protein